MPGACSSTWLSGAEAPSGCFWMSSAVIWYWLLPMSGDSVLRAWSSWAWTVTASRSLTDEAGASAAEAKAGRLARARAKVMPVARGEGFMVGEVAAGCGRGRSMTLKCYSVTNHAPVPGG